MIKQIAFCKKDEELIKKILSYQQEKGIPSFTEWCDSFAMTH